MNTSNIEIEPCQDWEPEWFTIRITPWSRWYGDYGWVYSTDEDHWYDISAETIEELYEKVAQEYNKWITQVELSSKKYSGEAYHIDNNGLKFSTIYKPVEALSLDKLKSTNAYREIGAYKDKVIAEQKKKEEEDRKRRELYQQQEQERRDKEEFLRLSKKFGKS